MKPAISVIIRTKNEAKYLGRVLKRLQEQQYRGSVEIIVVDSGSTDNTVSIAEEFRCRIIRITSEEFSFGRALNIGFEYAKGEIIINLSGHSEPVNTDYFDLIVNPFSDRTIAATFGRDVPRPEACPSQARDTLHHFPATELDGNKFSNANAAIRKECWEYIKFDEELPASEDLLWAKQVMNRGYKIQYIPEAEVFHSHSASLKYIHRRSVIESKSTNAFVEIKQSFGISQAMKFFFGRTIKDMVFSLGRNYSLLWLFHIPFYRFSQSIGLLRGVREGSRLYVDALSKVGSYSVGREIPKHGRKVLMVTHCFFPESVGGTEYYTLNLAKKLIERGWEVKIISAMRDLTQKRYKVMEGKYDGINVIKIVNPSELCTTFVDYFIDHNVDHIFAKILKQERPDIVHFQHTAYLSSRLPEVSRQLGIPSIFTLHDYWYMCFRSQLIRPSEGVCPGPSEGLYCATCYDFAHPNVGGIPRFPFLTKILQVPIVRRSNIKNLLSPDALQKVKRFLYKSPGDKIADGRRPSPEFWALVEHSFRMNFMKRQLSFPAYVISPSVHLKKRYEREGFREVLHIPHGFEPHGKLDNFPYNGRLVFAYLGNIIPFKGADVILRDLRHMKRRQDIKILFYGKVLDGAYQKSLETLAKEYPDVEISFMGPYKGKAELERILPNLHFIVFPSLWEENCPLVLRETLLYGVPVIGSKLGGVPEAIEDGVNGYIFDPGKEGDLAEKINRILETPELLEKITEGARNTKIESMEDHVEKVITLYGSALETHR